jgi:hypothetical protein
MTTHQIRHDRLIIQLNDEDLEKFVREWMSHKKEYVEVERFTGPGDMGRDVVGFLTHQRHEGPWHNYQCKQYGRTLQTAVGMLEVGKVLYFSHRGEFTPPTSFFFVAPRGVNRNLKRFIANPSSFKRELIDKWNEYCADAISKGTHVALDPALRAFIERWDFSQIHSLSVDAIMDDPASKPVLQSWFGADPGPPPLGKVPGDIESREMPYIRQLLDAYGEREECAFQSYTDIENHAVHGEHVRMQRERFFDADAFSRFYRDNVMSQEIDLLTRDIFYGVVDTNRADHADSLTRVDAVMTQAANVHPSGALAKYARVPVKQGICHHFANEGRLKWRQG